MKIFQLAIVLYFAILHVTSTTAIPELVCHEEAGTLIYAVNLEKENINIEEHDSEGFHVEVLEEPSDPAEPPSSPVTCSAQGILKITFPDEENGMQNQRLKVKLIMDTEVTGISGYSFHIGDGQGRAGSTPYSAEVFSQGRDWLVNARLQVEAPGNYRYNKLRNVIASDVDVTIGDEYVKLEQQSIGPIVYSGKYLYALRGQDDYEVFIGLNRLVTATDDRVPSGTGLCRIEITALPCDECQV